MTISLIPIYPYRAGALALVNTRQHERRFVNMRSRMGIHGGAAKVFANERERERERKREMHRMCDPSECMLPHRGDEPHQRSASYRRSKNAIRMMMRQMCAHGSYRCEILEIRRLHLKGRARFNRGARFKREVALGFSDEARHPPAESILRALSVSPPNQRELV